MKLFFNIVLLLLVVNLSLIAQKTNKGHSIDISGETIEINFPARNKKVEEIKQSDEIKQLENSIQNELKDYTIEMQDQRFISDNVITEVHIDTSNIDGNASLKVIYSYTLQNDTMKLQTDDFGLGKYLVKESNALLVTLAVMEKNIEGKLAKYINENKKISITINGSADAVPITRVIPYRGEFGEQLFEDCSLEGQKQKMEVTTSKGISSNPTLAFIRSYAVRDYLQTNIFQKKFSNLKYSHSATVSGQRGGQFRRVYIEIVIYNAFE
jgi:hypothetical protein